jgi:hypothetical protein
LLSTLDDPVTPTVDEGDAPAETTAANFPPLRGGCARPRGVSAALGAAAPIVR